MMSEIHPLRNLKGRLRKVIIHLSPYHNGSPAFVKAMEEARRLAQETDSMDRKIFQSTTACRPIYEVGRASLKQHFHFLAQWQNTSEARATIAPFNMFGIFAGTEEPSFALEMLVPQQFVTQTKLAAIAFGEEYSQETVHFTESLRGKPLDRIPEMLGDDETWEFARLYTMRSLIDIFTAQRWAQESGVQNLSMRHIGNQILIYSMGNRSPAQPKEHERMASFRRFVKAYCPETTEKGWHMKLSNYGNRNYGATHTYAEARRLLLRQCEDEEQESDAPAVAQ